MTEVTVFVHAPDPISLSGVVAQLRGQRDIRLVDDLTADVVDVAVVIADGIGLDELRSIRAIQRNAHTRVVVLVSSVDEAHVLSAVEEGVVGVLRRGEASGSRLVELIRAASDGGGSLPADLLGGLMRQVKFVHTEVLSPRGLSFSHLNRREVDVLRLMADGYDTREIADQLCYSERTIKNVVHDVVRRFGLRNRSHAVAYALRQGLI